MSCQAQVLSRVHRWPNHLPATDGPPPELSPRGSVQTEGTGAPDPEAWGSGACTGAPTLVTWLTHHHSSYPQLQGLFFFWDVRHKTKLLFHLNTIFSQLNSENILMRNIFNQFVSYMQCGPVYAVRRGEPKKACQWNVTGVLLEPPIDKWKKEQDQLTEKNWCNNNNQHLKTCPVIQLCEQDQTLAGRLNS